ncbi:Isoleucine--tRNA ligase [Frankliniella fusca]|uniref:Isoleucine--tRNA ligase n=1 Tax=Frankliniella fusca TaxID=407009 RepID=A0AAE1LIF6_9NEOP|nr:Isoleucine--tRNA ligase [Frankliniella fusca]
MNMSRVTTQRTHYISHALKQMAPVREKTQVPRVIKRMSGRRSDIIFTNRWLEILVTHSKILPHIAVPRPSICYNAINPQTSIFRQGNAFQSNLGKDVSLNIALA